MNKKFTLEMTFGAGESRAFWGSLSEKKGEMRKPFPIPLLLFTIPHYNGRCLATAAQP